MDTSGKIRIALIGCGAIAAKHIAAVGSLPDAVIAGAYDKSAAAAEAFSKKYSIPVFETPEKLVEAVDPHVFDVVTPSGVHAANVFELLKFNRHFIVEKPLALRLDQIDGILAECDARGLKVFVVQQNRFNPPVVKLKEALDSGRFGKIVMGTVRVRWARRQEYYDEKSWRGTWAYDGGALTNQASHFIDMLIWLLGDAESVMAKTATRLIKMEAEDTGIAVIKFRSGALGLVEATVCARPKDMEGSISVLGEFGSVEIGGFFMNELKSWNFTGEDAMDVGLWENHAMIPKEFAWNHARFFENAVKSIKESGAGLIDGLEGRKSVELISAIYESAETGMEVPLKFAPRKCRLGEGA